jgi:hypothetical protein
MQTFTFKAATNTINPQKLKKKHTIPHKIINEIVLIEPYDRKQRERLCTMQTIDASHTSLKAESLCNTSHPGI